MNICFFNNVATFGGGEIWALRAARWFRAHGYGTAFVCPYYSPLFFKAMDDGFDIYAYMPMDGVPVESGLREFLVDKMIDIVYCTVIGELCEAHIVDRCLEAINARQGRSRTGFVLKAGLPPMSGLTPEYYGAGCGSAFLRLHVVTDDIRRAIITWTDRISPTQVVIRYEGVDTERFSPCPGAVARESLTLPEKWRIPAHARIVTCLSRLEPVKNQEALITSIPGILRHYPSTVFVFAGEGSDRRRLERLTQSLGVVDAVRFLGYIDDPVVLLRRSDVVCQPSLAEGLPNAVAEAMAVGCGVVASAVGGICDLVDHGVDGLLFNPNVVGNLNAQLLKVLGNRELAVELGRRGRDKIVRRFDGERCMEALAVDLGHALTLLRRDTGSNRTVAPVTRLDPPRTVALMLHSMRIGGEETEVAILSRYLNRARFHPVVIVSHWLEPDCPAMKSITKSGVEIDTTPCTLGDDGQRASYVARLLASENAALLVAFQDTRLAYAVMSMLGHTACALIEHGGIPQETHAIPKDMTARYIGVSRAICAEAAALMRNPRHAISLPSMIDVKEFACTDRKRLRGALGIDDAAVVVLFVGRLDRRKRIELVLVTAAAVLAEIPNILFLIVGGSDAYQSEYAGELMALARPLTETGRLVFTGPRDDVPLLLCASDIVMLPAVNEGMSHVISEAGAAGCAVVATDDGAAREQLDNGAAGMLVAADRDDLWTEKVRYLALHEEARRMLGEALRQKVGRDYDASSVVRRWEAVLAEVAGERGVSVPVPLFPPEASRESPLEIQIQTTTFCNARCVMCPHEEASRELSQGRMDLALYKRIVAECAEMGVQRIEPFLMNEPFTDGRMPDLISYAKATAPRAMVTVTTNGSLVTRPVADALARSGLDAIWFSVNGATPEMYYTVMGIDLEVTAANIEYLNSIRPARLRIFVNMVETTLLAPEIERNLRRWTDMGISAGVSPLVNRGGNVRNFKALACRRQNGEPVRVCEHPFRKMFILYNGDAVLCCMDWRRQTVLGNVHEQSLSQIWKGSRMREIRTRQVERKLSDLVLCGGCSYVRQ